MKALITNKLTEHSVTPEAVYLNRRQWLKASAVGAAGLLAPSMKAVEVAPGDDPAPPWLQSQNKQASPSSFSST